ncbi:MAG: hypothetical protein EAZ58_14425, partial [Flavobacterium sp.]
SYCRTFSKYNYRFDLKVYTRSLGIGMDAHPIFTQAERFQQHWDRVGLNIHDPANMAWWEKHAHGANAAEYNRQWDRFFFERAGSPPDIQEIQDFGKKLMQGYGF